MGRRITLRRLLVLPVAAAVLTAAVVRAEGLEREPERPAAQLVGTVSDGSGTAVAGATVKVVQLNKSTETDAGGIFEFRDLAPGSVTLEFRAEGFYPTRQDSVQLPAGEAVAVEVVLESKEVVTESIVVTGTGTAHTVMDAPVRTELITEGLLDAQVKRTVSEALTANVPGLRVETNCGNCGFTAVRLNGLQGPYTQVLEDGLPTMSGLAMVYGLEQIPAEFLERIEVVKGGNSSLYGPNAIAGVINLVRREPRETFFKIDATAGWHKGRPDQQIGAASQVRSLPGGFTGDFYYRGIHRTQIDRHDDYFSDLPRRRLQSGGASLFRHVLGGNARLAFGGSAFEEFRRGGDMRFHLPPEQTYITEQLDTFRSTSFLRWNHTVTPATFYAVNTSLTYVGRDSYYGVQFDPNAYGNTRNPLWTNDVQLGHQAGRHTLMGGFQYWREFVADRIPSYGRDFSDLFVNTGLYFQDEFRISPRVVVVGGLRADKSNVVDDWVWSPRGNIRIGLTQNLNLRAGVSTGFRPPTVFDEDLHLAAAGGEAFISERGPGLREERSVSFNAALDYAGRVGGREFEAGASFFWTELRHNFQYEEAVVEEFRKLIRVNGAGAYVRGVDLNAQIQLHARAALRGGATFQVARFNEPEDQFNSYRFFRTPNRYGFAELITELPWEIELLQSTELTGSMLAPHYAGFISEDRLETTKRFVVWNAVVGRDFSLSGDRRSLRLYFAARNILDDVQPDIDQGPLKDSNYVYGPLQMRQFNAGMTLQF